MAEDKTESPDWMIEAWVAHCRALIEAVPVMRPEDLMARLVVIRAGHPIKGRFLSMDDIGREFYMDTIGG